MPRHARLRIPGLPLHVIQRGNNRSACFRSESDCRLYLGMLEELAKLFGCSVHAYVLMTNHVHLLLSPERPEGVSLLMKNLGQRYVQAFNRSQGRSGSLWEGRFRSSIVDTDAYFLRCQRYIELNPVRAAMVAHPAEYPWSSFQANALGKPSTLIVPHSRYLELGSVNDERRARYRGLFECDPGADELKAIRSAVNAGLPLGLPGFVDRIEAALGKPGRLRKGGRPNRSKRSA